MMIEKENIIMQYISVWAWHIIAIIFLVSGFNILFSGESLGNHILFIVFILMWMLSEIIALRRKAALKIENLRGQDE